MGNTPSFTSVVESRNGVAHVALAGELDLATVSEFSRSLEGCHWGAIDAIILDLRNLSFVDSTGLQAVLEARSRAQANQRNSKHRDIEGHPPYRHRSTEQRCPARGLHLLAAPGRADRRGVRVVDDGQIGGDRTAHERGGPNPGAQPHY